MKSRTETISSRDFTQPERRAVPTFAPFPSPQKMAQAFEINHK
jgi:hypothetical protein